MPPSAYFAYPPEHARIDPFDTEVEQPQFIDCTNNGITYAYLRGSFEDVPAGEYQRLVPMGYTSLMLAQKLAVARDGRVVREWPLVARRATGADNDRWFAEWGVYRVWSVAGGYAPIADPNDRDSADAALLAASRPDAALLLYVWASTNRH
jgi:hypothetical protein